MKKLLFTLLMAIIASASLQAQKGEIIYTDYGTDGLSYEWQLVYEELPADWTYSGDTPLELDFDHDGVIDFAYNAGVPWYADDWPLTTFLRLYCHWHDSSSVQQYNCVCDFLQIDTGGKPYVCAKGDTIANISDNGDFPTWNIPTNGWVDFPYFAGPISFPQYIAFRVKKDEGYCYGWIEESIECGTYPSGHGGWEFATEVYMPKVTVLGMAYCTIPNYPLRLGQTSFDWGIEDNEATTFATLHPNPTNGLVTITGKDLTQAEVLNALGQQVATAQGKGKTLHIDIANLPTGVYFVRITDEEGRTCVRKVVKE